MKSIIEVQKYIIFFAIRIVGKKEKIRKE